MLTLGTMTVASLLTVQAASLDDLAWLAGRWTGETEGRTTEEVWMAPAGGVMVGMHRDVTGADRSFHEFLMIRESASGIDYVASPRGGPSTAFRLTGGDASHAVFTNPDHDYPQRIEYRVEGDELRVSISDLKRDDVRSWAWTRDAGRADATGIPKGDTAYVMLPRDREIALARSAAPGTVSSDATVWVIADGVYRVAVAGTNGNHCFVARTYPRSMEPVCYDPEASRTILPIEIRRFELRRQGYPPAEIDRIVHMAIGNGKLPIPERPAMSYMMSSAQVLYGEDGSAAGNWKPHLMLYMPYASLELIGAMNGPTDEVMVVDAGQPTAYVMVVVPEFVDPVFDRR